MDWRWIDLRKPERALIFKVWTTFELAFSEYCSKNGFIEIHSPKFMESPSEGSAELFEVKYFDRKAYLAQSCQFYKQMAMAAGLERVFEIGPVFRANPSFTARHDTEFTQYDIEMSFIDSYKDVMAFEEGMLVYVLTRVKEKHAEGLKKYYGMEVEIPSTPFPAITFKEAHKLIKNDGIKGTSEESLLHEEELAICRAMKEKTSHEFVFVTEYPASDRAFYHMRYDGTKTTKGYDLFWKGYEITTGAQREHRYKVLKAQAEEKKIGLKSIEKYLEFFKYGCPPHGGFGFGVTRALMALFGIMNVREVTYLYRGVKRLRP
jgi:aspartyl-tRNA synthetase